jgi:hypothetical protein
MLTNNECEAASMKLLDIASGSAVARLKNLLHRPSGGVPSEPIAIRPLVTILAAALLSMAVGCQDRPTDGPPPDEAMVRAEKEKKTPEQAAVEYFKPKAIVDYFPQMDTVGQPVKEAVHWPDQLLDQIGNAEFPLAPQDKRPEREVGPLQLIEDEKFGRNAWMIWCAGNEGFWDWLANNSYGSSDLLKLLDSRNRGTLFRDAGLINEPEMTREGTPQEFDFGLWLAAPSKSQPREVRNAYLKRAFAAAVAGQLAPGYDGIPGEHGAVKSGNGSYDNNPPPEIYGLSSGVIGLRLFPNPKFNEAARKEWNAKRYYEDPDYYSNPKLIRPYRVGMSCAFCHTSFHPLNPPRDLTDPRWENLSGNIGAQYLRIRSVFGNVTKPDNFVYHLLDSQPPGTIDTSLIPSDNINNTNAMNSIFGLPDRVALSFKNPAEKLTTTGKSVTSLWPQKEIEAGKIPKNLLTAIPELVNSNDSPRRVPRVLFDGADCIGVEAALSRVFLNIGEYWEQWILLHEPFIGFRPQEPFKIVDCEKHSVYWNATQLRIGPLRDYFLRITPPMRLLDVKEKVDRRAAVDEKAVLARGDVEKVDHKKLLAAERALRIDVSKLKRGREVFARNCIVCHSSIQTPERFAEMAEWGRKGEYWDHDPGRWLADESYLKWALKAVEDPEFWKKNYLSTDYRIAINLVRTNSARSMATNAMSGRMWEDFSSESYQAMPSVGSIKYFNPYLGAEGGEDDYTPRHKAPIGVPGGGGPGFYRVPTLISIWTSAPLLHNNSLGLFNNDPSVDGRLASFDDAIRKLLWPDRRLESSSYNEATAERLKRDHGLIWRTTQETYLNIPARIVPAQLSRRVGIVMRILAWFPWLQNIKSLWLPSFLLVAAFVALLKASRWKTRFWLGYVPLVSALLIGSSIFFLNGRLGDLRLGPIPKGTPVNLIANINPDADPEILAKAINVTWSTLSEIESRHLGEEETQKLMREKVAPALLAASKCPDMVMDQGHYYEWFKTMSDEDKESLIELLKTF